VRLLVKEMLAEMELGVVQIREVEVVVQLQVALLVQLPEVLAVQELQIQLLE